MVNYKVTNKNFDINRLAKISDVRRLERWDSYVQHLVCPESELLEERNARAIRKLRHTNGKKNKAKPFLPIKGELRGWEMESNQSSVYLGKRAATSHVKVRATSDALDSLDETPRPKTALVPRAALMPRERTPAQKARLGARCLLTGRPTTQIAPILNGLDSFK